ncbi:MAG: hypothetical protein ACPGTG_08350 [Flavobacteriales bacterium]
MKYLIENGKKRTKQLSIRTGDTENTAHAAQATLLLWGNRLIALPF